ncbi:MAG TPA: hypothetical protein DDW52_27385 [Planctomycetaceae bacterium]|nr:hypothetical protein [Planctomycetaceae bacterium]
MRSDYSLGTASKATGKRGRSRRPIEIAMTPMIDVIFLLLVFFLATSSFQAIEYLLPSGVSKPAEPPTGAASPTQLEPNQDAIDQVVIKLAMEGETCKANLNGSELSFEALEDRLIRIANVKLTVPIVVDPAAKVPVQYAVKAYDYARAAGFARVFFATRAQ